MNSLVSLAGVGDLSRHPGIHRSPWALLEVSPVPSTVGYTGPRGPCLYLPPRAPQVPVSCLFLTGVCDLSSTPWTLLRYELSVTWGSTGPRQLAVASVSDLFPSQVLVGRVCRRRG